MWFWLVLAWGWEFSLSSILELGELQIEYYSIWWIKLRNHYSSTLKITGMPHHYITPQILYICRKIWRILWWGFFFILKTLWKRKLRNYDIIFTIEDFWTVLLSLRLTEHLYTDAAHGWSHPGAGVQNWSRQPVQHTGDLYTLLQGPMGNMYVYNSNRKWQVSRNTS